MRIAKQLYRRGIYMILWLPVLLVPVLFLILAFVSNDTSEHLWDGHFVVSMLMYLVLFLVHDLILVRKLFLQKKFKAYFLAVICLLAAFTTSSYLRLHPEHHLNKPASQERHPAGHPEDFADGKPAPSDIPRREKAAPRQEKPLREPDKDDDRDQKGPSPVMLDFIIASLLIGSNLSVVLFRKYLKERERNSELEHNKLQQELKYLKAQLNPHFFMNMLNNIHGMIDISPDKAQEMIMELSQLMRYVLYEGARPYTSLATEIAFINTYIALMRKRYSNKKIHIDLQLPGQSTDGIILPPLLFIVIIENAFKHGISYRNHSEFFISMETDDRHIRFHCRNNKFHDDRAQKKPGGIGLANLRRRLELLYGGDFSLDIKDEDNLYTVNLTIPYEHEPDKMRCY